MIKKSINKYIDQNATFFYFLPPLQAGAGCVLTAVCLSVFRLFICDCGITNIMH